MKLLRLEFIKCRRRKITLVCAAVVAVEMIWMGVAFLRQGMEKLEQGWMDMLYNLALLDAIVLPLSVATLASRSCELEHKGNTWKLLETMTAPGKLYTVKFIWGSMVLAALLAVRSGAFLALGIAMGFQGALPLVRFSMFTLISWAVSMMVYALQQGLSLKFSNQAAALVCGIFGSFMGLLSLLFPPVLTRCVPWGYYGLLALVRMEWNETTRAIRFFWRWPPVTDLALLCLWGVLFLLAGRILFLRKEV